MRVIYSPRLAHPALSRADSCYKGYVVHRAFSHCQQLAGAGLHDFITPRMERKANNTGVMLYLDIKVAAIWAVFLFFIHTKYFHICFFSPFIALRRCRPALTLARKRRRCGSGLLLPDILQRACHLTFHSNDGQGRVATFSLSQRAFL